MDVRARRRALLVSVVVVVATAWPALSSVLGAGDRDGFPLSTYPMFAHDRGRIVDVATVVAVDTSGSVVRLDPDTVARTDQVIQANVTVERAVAGGASTAGALCRDVATRVPPDEMAEVRVVVERYDSVRWAGGNREPRSRRTVAACDVGP